MAVTQNIKTFWYATDNKEGVNLNTPITSVGDFTSLSQELSIPLVPFALGERVQGQNGSEWIFVQATVTVTAYNLVAIDANFKARNCTDAIMASNLYSFGVAEFQASVANGSTGGDYFWACTMQRGGGLISAAASSSCLRGTLLYLLGTLAGGGQVTTSVSTTALRYIFANTSTLSTTGFTDYLQTSYIVISL